MRTDLKQPSNMRTTGRSRRKFVVFIATSADGYIARLDGDVGWLDRPRPPGNYGMDSFFRSIDTILWGRKTYDKGIEMGGSVGSFGAKVKNYVFSRRPPRFSAHDVEFLNEPVAAFANRLRATLGKDIWLMGGGGLIGSFLDADQVDEFIINIVPVFIGEGIPLIQARPRSVPLFLRSSQRYPDGVLRLHYSVIRKPPGKADSKKNSPAKRDELATSEVVQEL